MLECINCGSEISKEQEVLVGKAFGLDEICPYCADNRYTYSQSEERFMNVEDAGNEIPSSKWTAETLNRVERVMRFGFNRPQVVN